MIRKDLDKHVTIGCQWRLVHCSYCNEPQPKCQGEVIIILSQLCFKPTAPCSQQKPFYLACLILAFNLERLCLNWERSLLNMRSMSLGYSFEPRPNSRALATEVLVVTIGFSLNSNKWMLHSKKPVWRERTRLTGPEVWAAATSKVWRDSSRAAFLLPTQEDQRRLCSHGDTTVISIQSSCFRIPP